MARSAENEQNTRQQLLLAAGKVFAEKGYDRATGKEICELAGTNSAAINYYFQGMEGLYSAVLVEAHNTIMRVDALTNAVAGKPDPKEALKAFIELFVRNITDPNQSSWMLKVIGREVLSPSAFIGDVRDTAIVPKLRIVKGIVSGLLGLPENHPTVARSFISIMAPCTTLMLFDKQLLKFIFPTLELGPANAPELAQHLYQYALAGIAAVAEEAKKIKSS